MKFSHLVIPGKAPFPAQAASLVSAPSASTLLLTLAPGRQAFSVLSSVLISGTPDLFLLYLHQGLEYAIIFVPLKSFERPQLRHTRKGGFTTVKTQETQPACGKD